MERIQRTYTVYGMLGILVAVLGFAVADGLRGAGSESQRSLWIVVLVALGLVSAARWPRPTYFPRLLMACLFAVIAYEGFIGANSGYSFLWCFVFPPGLFFLLGRREGTFWFVVTAALTTWLVFVADRPTTVDGPVGVLALAVLTLLGVLCHGLEGARSRQRDVLVSDTQKLQKALADIEALHGMVRICAACKRTRDDQGFWNRIETYLAQHSAVDLQPAMCPTCADCSDASPPAPPLPSLPSSLRLLEHPSEKGRRRQAYLTLGLSLFIPFLLYFGSIDIRAGRVLEASLVYGLAVFLVGSLLALRRWPHRSQLIYHLAAAASFLLLVYELHVGAYGGFAVMWFYAYPGFVIFLLGNAGLLWSAAGFLLSTTYLLAPVGFAYPQAFAVRFIVTSLLVLLLLYLLEVSRRRASARLEAEQAALRGALNEVQTLRGLLPMCPSCKNVRDDQGFWESVETHVSRVSGAQFSHGLCPDCAAATLAELETDGVRAD